jgi:hypothetical protein
MQDLLPYATNFALPIADQMGRVQCPGKSTIVPANTF